MKIFTVALCTAVFLAAPAFALTRDFTDFSVDLPPGWTVKREGRTTAFTAPDGTASMQVAVELLTRVDGMNAEELAEAYAAELNGSRPVMVDNDPNYYSFTFKSPDGTDSEASVVVAGSNFYLITVSGRHKDMAGLVESLLLSIL
ncbi:MAG: hypothetical protein LBQ51_08555 [Desulfovibrio sp.]|jgi:hypothetical protein|nr:hypothetical protein [Desulfovibrio sp.]